MSMEQGYRLVTRAFVVFFLFWVFVDAVSLPHQLLTLTHYVRLIGIAHQTGREVDGGSYLLRSYPLSLCETVLKIVVYLFLAGWFHRGSHALRRFFGLDPISPNDTGSLGQ